MKARIRKPVMRLVLLGVLTLVLTSVILAQSGGSYDLTWNTVDGGGGTSSGGSYTLSGTAGQPDAGTLSDGGYTLAGGFWGGTVAVAARYRLYLPLIVKGYSGVGFSYEVSDCLGSSGRAEGDQVEIRVEGRDIVMEHRGVSYNCCATMVIDLSDQRPLLQLIERETYPDNPPCRCLCPYDLKARIMDLPPGTYHVEVWDEGRTHLFGSAWVTIG